MSYITGEGIITTLLQKRVLSSLIAFLHIVAQAFYVFQYLHLPFCFSTSLLSRPEKSLKRELQISTACSRLQPTPQQSEKLRYGNLSLTNPI